MILRQNTLYYPNLKLDLDQYYKVYKDNRNKMTPMSMGGIALMPKHDRVSYYFMSLETGRIIHERQWNVLHIP